MMVRVPLMEKAYFRELNPGLLKEECSRQRGGQAKGMRARGSPRARQA